MPTLCDSYSESNYSYDAQINNVWDGSSNTAVGQSFTGNGEPILSCKFYLKKEASPTGNMIARLYAHSGTFGTSSVPTGAVLDSSSAIASSSLTTSYQLIEFTGFAGYTLVNGTKYCILVEGSSATIDGTNKIRVGGDTSSPSHGGNYLYRTAGGWGYSATVDTCFYVYTTADATKISADTGTGSDSSVLLVGHSRSETGSGVDASIPSASQVRSDIGSGIDAFISLVASIIDDDTGAGVDVLEEIWRSANEVFSSDSGTGTDKVESRVIESAGDSGTITELAALTALIMPNDTGSGTDISTLLLASLIKTDTGTGVEASTIVTVLQAAETALGVDASTLLALYLRTDTGSGVDLKEALSQLITDTDTGSGSDELESLIASIADDDTGSGEESIGDRSIVLTELGAGSELSALLASYTVTEIGSAVDAFESLSVLIQKTDSGEAIEASTLQALIQSAETGVGTDAKVALLVSLLVADSGAGIDTLESLLNLITSSDTGTGVDSSILLNTNRVLRLAIINSAYRKIMNINSQYRKLNLNNS